MWKNTEMKGRVTDLLTKRRWKRVLVGYYILLVLAKGGAYGNQLVETIEKHTNGVYIPNPNELYPVLQSMESWGVITSSSEVRNSRRKHVYYITEDGYEALPILQRALKEWFEGRRLFMETIERDLFRDLSDLEVPDALRKR